MFFNVLDQQRNETTVCENPINRSLDRIKTMNETSVGIFVVFSILFPLFCSNVCFSLWILSYKTKRNHFDTSYCF